MASSSLGLTDHRSQSFPGYTSMFVSLCSRPYVDDSSPELATSPSLARASPTLAQSSRKRTPARSSPEPIVQVSGSQASGSQARQSVSGTDKGSPGYYRTNYCRRLSTSLRSLRFQRRRAMQHRLSLRCQNRKARRKFLHENQRRKTWPMLLPHPVLNLRDRRSASGAPENVRYVLKLTMSKEEDKKRAFMQETTLEDMTNVAPCPDSPVQSRSDSYPSPPQEQWANFLILPEDSSPASSPQKPQKRAKTSDDEWLDLESFYDRNRPMSRAEVDALFESHLEKPAEPGTWNGGSLWKNDALLRPLPEMTDRRQDLR
ncbi:hypothetical protein OF83DRAFT_1116950, partial [Amylostereum chailletii]